MSDILKKALTQYGIKEIPGKENNPEILKYFEILDDSLEWEDSTAWCSAFMNWVCTVCGMERSGKLNARSWLRTGTYVPLGAQEVGDIVILWRVSKDSWQGHVGLYINQIGDNINVLGGNQGNQVCIRPYSTERILGFVRV